MRNKNLLIVDLESQYLTDDDYMGLLSDDVWESTRKQMTKQYIKFIKKVN
jgi:hypothetical protein